MNARHENASTGEGPGEARGESKANRHPKFTPSAGIAHPRLPRADAIRAAIDPAEFYRGEIDNAPQLKANGDGWTKNFHCPFHEDANGSFGVNLVTGAFRCFGCDARGGSIIDFAMLRDRLTLDQARADLAQRYGVDREAASGKPRPKATKRADPTPKRTPETLAPIPPAALETRPQRVRDLGEASASWAYVNADGLPVGFVCRFETRDKQGRPNKTFRPQHWTEAGGWKWTDPPGLWPLYRFDQLTARPAAPVAFCEGEKSADAAAVLLPDHVTTATAHGAQSPQKSDFGPLVGRRVQIWPDHDAPGADYARKVAELARAAGCTSVEVLDLSSLARDPKTGEPRELPEKWDAANALDNSWTAETLASAARWGADRAENTDADAESLDDTIPRDDEPKPAAPKVPDGWSLTRRMVFEVKPRQGDKPDEYVPICGHLRIIGRTTGPHRDWGLMLAFRDHDETEQRAAIPAARLHEDPAILARELATQGLRVVPGREKRMLAYLDAWDVTTRILSAKRLGWMEDPTGALSFVLPDRVIARNGTREVVFQPERFSPTVKTVHASGTLADWQAQVAAPACNHNAMLFALYAGLAPAFLAFAEAGDSFVLHFWGKTSRGKTTVGQIAASPWGCAADPNDAPSMTFVRRWNLTGNGLEGLAEAHSDLPLVLDELGAATVGDIRPLVYQLSGGQGKTALNSAREMKEPRAWRTIAISTGELSLHARMSDPDGDGIRTRTVKGGLTHRALDVELTDIAKSADEAKREGIVSGIKTACARYYGTAGPELIRLMVEQFSTAAEVRAYVRDRVKAVMPKLTGKHLPIETARAVRRFALIAVAGEFAAEKGLFPATPEAVRAATRQIVTGWIGASAETDDARIVASVRGFIQRHAARFQATPEPTQQSRATSDPDEVGGYRVNRAETVRDRCGWLNRLEDLWLFTDAGLTEAAPGNDKTTIARVLRQYGFLFTNEAGKLRARVSVGEEGRPWLYAVHGKILDGEESEQPSNSTGQPGQPGQGQQPQGPEPVPVDEMAPGQPGQPSGTMAGTEPVPPATVPVVPVGSDDRDSPQAQQPRGFVPPVPPVPPKSKATENYSGADADPEEDRV